MAQMLYRLGRLTYLNRWKTLVVWLLLIAGMAAAAANLSQPLSNNFTIPGLESIEAQDKIKERFNTSDDALTAPTAKVIVQAPEGKTLEDSDVSADVDKLVTSLKDSGKLKDTDELVNPVMAAMGMKQQLTEQKAAQGIPQEQIDADLKAISPLSEDRRTGTIDITFDAEKAADVTSEQRNAITTIISNDSGNLTTAYSGNAFQDSESLGMQSELIGITVAAVVLIITFGSLVAAGLPFYLGAADCHPRICTHRGGNFRTYRAHLAAGFRWTGQRPAAAHQLPPHHAGRHRLRPGHGLPSFPGQSYERRLRTRQNRRQRRGQRLQARRARGHGRSAHHDQRVRRLHAH